MGRREYQNPSVFTRKSKSGHSSMETTMLYVLPDLEKRKAVVERMQRETIQ